jgi:hypothetical protein
MGGLVWFGEFPVDLLLSMAGSHETQVQDGDQITYPRSARPPALCTLVKGASLDVVSRLEASHAVHLPRRIDLRPSATAVVCMPQILDRILHSEMSPLGACRGYRLSC